jgi:hypothetical protein
LLWRLLLGLGRRKEEQGTNITTDCTQSVVKCDPNIPSHMRR